MYLTHLLYALFVGLGIAWLFGLALGTRGPWNSFFWFFFVIFLFSWGGGVWITPFGPTGWGVAWMPFLFMGFFVTLLLLAATPRSARERRAAKGKAIETTNLKERTAEERLVETGVNVFLWLLIVFLVVVIVCNYIWHPGHSMHWSY
jgi:multisubunit Na+/H+ antiporter MnhB subunit